MATIFGLIGEVAYAQTIIVPSLTVSETYDSNVFWAPKSLLTPGSKPEDFYTTVTPQLTMAHTGSLIRGNFTVGGLITKYIHNPDLDYNGVNAAGRLDLQQVAQRMSGRFTSLSVNGSYQFTPSMSQFGAVGGQLGAGYGSTTPVGLGGGLVTSRVSVHNINAGMTAGYEVSRTTNVTGSYNYTGIFFGQQSGGGVSTPLFDTAGHNAAVTTRTQLNLRDTVGATASISHYSQQNSENGGGQQAGSQDFTVPVATLNWSRRWTQELNTTFGFGGQLTLPQETPDGRNVKTQLFPTASAGISYSSFSEALKAVGSAPGPYEGMPALPGILNPGMVMSPGQYTAALNYNYSIFPSYAYDAGPIKTHVVGANFSGGITAKLSGQVGMNFAHGSSATPVTSFTYDTLGLTVGARYLLGPILVSLTYNWLYFANSSFEAERVSGDYAFSKQSVMLALSYAFSSQSFFKADTFGTTGASGRPEGSSGPSGGGSNSLPPTKNY